jgi:transcriptional repressor NrdR
MNCPFCQEASTEVKDSRSTEENKAIRRRRWCSRCKGRFTTFERITLRELFVVKRSGVKKKFDREKVVKSMLAAVRKRKVSIQQIEEIADKILHELECSSAGSILTRKIGEMIMKSLASIDQVAYIRFASVYRDFSSAQDFAKFISGIKS